MVAWTLSVLCLIKKAKPFLTYLECDQLAFRLIQLSWQALPPLLPEFSQPQPCEYRPSQSITPQSRVHRTTPLSSASTPTFTSTVSGMSGGYVSSDGPYTGLSHSAVAGISVGSCAAGVILIIGGFLLWRHRKQKQAVDQSTEKDFERNSASPDDNSAILGFSEADSRTSTYAGTKSELPGSPVTANTSQRDSLASQRSQPQPPSPLSKEQYYYRPFRYQPANGFDNIQELPTQERTAYTQTGSRLSSLENAVTNAGRQHNGNNDIHELPG